MFANQPQTIEIVGRHWFFEPAHTEIGELRCHRKRFFAAVSTVCINEESGGRTDRVSRRAYPLNVRPAVAADLHLDAGETLGDPGAELALQFILRVRSEPAATVRRD